MNNQTTRMALYFERWGISLAFGLCLILPLHFKSVGWNEIVFGQVYAIGTVGTILTVALSAALIRRFGLNRIIPIGSLLYAIGTLFYCLWDKTQGLTVFYLASFLQGAGWGLSFTVGPIGIASTLAHQSNTADRTYYFTVYSAYTALGVGMGPLLIRWLVQSYGLTPEHILGLAMLSAAIASLVSAKTAWSNPAYQHVVVSTLSGVAELIAIFKQPSIYFFGMVLLGACIYTTMISLQIPFAVSQGIDYTIFFACYSLAVVLARFFLSKPLSKVNAFKSITWLMLTVILGLGGLFLADRSFFFYALGSLCLGVGYGLVYPIIQAESVRYIPQSLNASTLVYFSLSYFLGVYLFPYIGALIATHYSYIALLTTLVIIALLELVIAVYFYRVCAKRYTINL